MATKGTHLVQNFNIDEVNRVLRLIQNSIANQEAVNATAFRQVGASISAVSGGGASGVVKTIYVPGYNITGGIVIDEVGRASLSPIIVLGP